MPKLTRPYTCAPRRWIAVGAIAAALACLPSQAAAQQDRQAQSVAERNAPEFTSRPIRVGSFDLFPTISAEVAYNDNIFALPNNEIDDAVITITPEIILTKRRPDRETRLNLSAGLRRFTDAISENSERFSANFQTRRGMGSGTQWNLGAGISQNFEQRRDIQSFNEASEPINFTRLDASAGVSQEFGPLRVSANARVRAVRFDGEIEVGGQVLDLSFRDFELYEGSLRGYFARSRNQEFYLQATADTRRFDLAPLFLGGEIVNFIDRTSTGGRIEAGYRRQVTELLYLDVRAGYLQQDFDDPAIDNQTGLAFSADLLWNATPLTSVKVTGRRQVDTNVNPNFSGLVRTEAQLQVEHELMRNILLIGRFVLADLNQNNSPIDGTQYNVSASARYRVSRFLGLSLAAERFERSSLAGITQNSVRAGVTYNF